VHQPTHLFEGLVNDIGVLEVIVGKEVELVQEIPDIYAAQGVHLGEGEHTGKSGWSASPE
jgi:hypothetical protein